ncbi:MAG: CRISPR-associated helicase Cas3' [Syntrophales bacterium]
MPPKIVSNLWAKTSKSDNAAWHPLILHMLDVAASADAILAREPEAARQRMAEVFGLSWDTAKPWVLLIIGCHDLGKACPGFQIKWEGAKQLLSSNGLRIPPGVDTSVNHAYVSQIALAGLLQELNWSFDLANLAADAVGCHHGERANPINLENLSGDRRVMEQGWIYARRKLFEAMRDIFQPSLAPSKTTLSGPDFMLLSGLTSFADWIGSNEEWFTFGTSSDCNDLTAWWVRRQAQAECALDAIGWQARKPLLTTERSFGTVFRNLSPRPLQEAVVDVVHEVPEPCIILVEAPMGEGKTEAAFYAHLELQRRFGHRGLYVALPTKATGNAMFERTLKFLHSLKADRTLDLQLLHGATLLNDTFQNLKLSSIHNPNGPGQIRAGEWFTSKKRALLSEYGVGTVDQALLTILPVRHNFVRLWGLANRVVVFDEIHAYDAYTATLLINLLRWLLALGSSVVLLSATLSPSIRRKLAEVVNAALPEQEQEYPRLSIFRPGAAKVEQKHFETDYTRRQVINLRKIGVGLAGIKVSLDEHLSQGGLGMAIVNTVQRAQDLFRLFPAGEPLQRDGARVGKRLPDGTEVYLFHARFPSDQRQKREEAALSVFSSRDKRSGRKILIATQVAEQSLDLDFDLIITDLAPIDLILQRAGRLWRHARGPRALAEPWLLVAGLDGNEPSSFGKPLWWNEVYHQALLLRTWCMLKDRQKLTLPDEIDALVRIVYEEQVEIPESLQERYNKALLNADGEDVTGRGQANYAIIGFPDDASWNQPERFILYDEDEPGVHRNLMAKTRLDADSIVAVPIFTEHTFDPAMEPDFPCAKQWFMRAVSIARKNIVGQLRAQGVPEGWKKAPLLRNCYPLCLDDDGRWTANATVRLDSDLGLVYEPKEAE